MLLATLGSIWEIFLLKLMLFQAFPKISQYSYWEI